MRHRNKARISSTVQSIAYCGVKKTGLTDQFKLFSLNTLQGVSTYKAGVGNLSAFSCKTGTRGMQKGFVPKCCLNCGCWFLQTPGMSFAYCDQIAPGETEKTCRDTGAVASFQEKVRSSEVWQIHQRAYKKYDTRVLKKNMTKDDFLLWARDAEKLRIEC